MLEGLWSIFSHPSAIAGWSDLPILIPAAIIVAALTAVFMKLSATRFSRIRPMLAILAGSAIVPAFILAFAALVAMPSPAGPPSTDGRGILVMAIIVMAICAIPVSFVVSFAFVLRQRRTSGNRPRQL